MFITNCRVRVPVLLCSVVMFISFFSDIGLFCWFSPGAYRLVSLVLFRLPLRKRFSISVIFGHCCIYLKG